MIFLLVMRDGRRRAPGHRGGPVSSIQNRNTFVGKPYYHRRSALGDADPQLSIVGRLPTFFTGVTCLEKNNDGEQSDVTLAVSPQETQTGLFISRRSNIAHITALSPLSRPPATAVLQASLMQTQTFVLIAATPPRFRSAVRFPSDRSFK
ncbi:hypothetical protein EVAR_66501_1 [Eumeta japonica]|uniref:Uncharacterized protein n=1 Tax=Eumeta variegata TaxID=151549 RepID=A0A4C1Z534_EUMVA|nr:hypothetical protein EVAR_66501_1 [Eumeta japonica]